MCTTVIFSTTRSEKRAIAFNAAEIDTLSSSVVAVVAYAYATQIKILQLLLLHSITALFSALSCSTSAPLVSSAFLLLVFYVKQKETSITSQYHIYKCIE